MRRDLVAQTRTRSPRQRFAALAFLLGAVLVGAPSCAAPRATVAQETLTVASPPLEQAALIYIASEQGFFGQQGLNVVIQDRDSGVTALQAVLRGEADVAETAEYPFVRLALQGEPLSLIATNDQFENDYVVARPDCGIKTLADLKGKRIGLARGTIVEFYLARLLELRGIDTQETTVVDLKPERFVDALARGEVDALVAWQPFVRQAKEKVAGAVVLPAQSSQPVFGVLAARRQWVQDHAGVVERFLKALAAAEDYLLRNPDESQAIVQRRLKYDPGYVASIWPQHQFALSLDQPLVIAMKDEAQWMIRSNVTTASALPDFGAHIYTSALEAARPGAVTLVR